MIAVCKDKGCGVQLGQTGQRSGRGESWRMCNANSQTFEMPRAGDAHHNDGLLVDSRDDAMIHRGYDSALRSLPIV